MGRIHIILNDNLEKGFRIKLAKKGFKKGDISKEIEQMIKNYLDNKRNIEIYNALCCLNVSIRDKQKERAKYVQRLINKLEYSK